MAAAGKKAAARSDFKHIKAKVGRRAPKPANVTDTAFKAASLAVRAQSIQAQNDGNASAATTRADSRLSSLQLFSSRGLSLHQLTTQLQHPAAAVRLSAVRGLADVVRNSDVLFLEAHLSDLIPAVAKSVVDEDDSVRLLGLSVLNDLLRSCRESVIGPFVPLMTAYVTSALHSLDRATRFDGGRAVDIISTAIPSAIAPHASKIFPAYVNLLSDHASTRGRRSVTDTGVSKERKKRRKTGRESSDSPNSVLRSLSSLLQEIPGELDETDMIQSGREMDGALDLVFDVTGRKNNGLFVSGLGDSQHVAVPAGLEAIAAVYRNEESSPTAAANRGSATALGIEVTRELLSKLRDSLVEVSQRGHNNESRGLMVSSVSEEDEFALIIACIEGVWRCYTSNSQFSTLQCPEQKTLQLRKIALNVMSLLLESFPVQRKVVTSDSAPAIDTLNAKLCVIIMKMGGSTLLASDSLAWIDQILEYATPRLQDDTARKSAIGTGVATSDITRIASRGTSGTIVDVISQLLLLQREPNEFTLSKNRRRSILKRVRDAYFSFESLDEGREVARSMAGRKAVWLLANLLFYNEYSILSDDKESLAPSLRRMVKNLPIYLRAWGHDFPTDTSMVISVLNEVVRRWSVERSATLDLANHIRDSMSPLFLSQIQLKKGKRTKNETGASFPYSIFERYPELSQRKLVGLMTLLPAPAVDTVNGLSATCANKATPQSLVNYILQSIHSVRRTLSMQTYLGFVINSVVLDGIDHDDVDRIATPRHVTSIQSATRYLILCGSQKVLPMVGPVLEQWMDWGSDNWSAPVSAKQVMRIRAGSCISVAMIRDVQTSYSDEGALMPSSYEVAPSITAKLTLLATSIFATRRAWDGKDGDDESSKTYEEILHPVMVLMRSDQTLTIAVIKQATHRICDPSEDSSRRSNILTALQHLIHDDRVRNVLRKCTKEISACCDSMDRSASEDSVRHQVSELRASSRLLFGNGMSQGDERVSLSFP